MYGAAAGGGTDRTNLIVNYLPNETDDAGLRVRREGGREGGVGGREVC